MVDWKRVLRRSFSVILIAATVLGLYNVYSDNAAVVAMAEATACGGRNCTARITRQERNPFTQSFTFQTSIKSHSTVDVTCARSLYLLGDYSCEIR